MDAGSRSMPAVLILVRLVMRPTIVLIWDDLALDSL